MQNKVFPVVYDLLGQLERTQMEQVEAAARLMADTIKQDGIVQAYGVGHSAAGASEICGRAGGFIPTKQLKEPSAGLYQDVPGAGETFMERVDVRPEDTLVLISNSGRNTMVIEIAIAAKAKGAKVIVVTALESSRKLTPKHKGGKNLYAYGDVVLDNCVMEGDSSIALEGLDTMICGMSSITTAVLLQAVVCRAVQLLLEDGIVPPIYKSINVDGGREFNKEYVARYADRLYRV